MNKDNENSKELTAEEAKEILWELYKKHEETGECGVYNITYDGKLGGKITGL